MGKDLIDIKPRGRGERYPSRARLTMDWHSSRFPCPYPSCIKPKAVPPSPTTLETPSMEIRVTLLTDLPSSMTHL